jgi:hypothetical protein
VPFSAGATAAPGSTHAVIWSDLFGQNAADFVGLFRPEDQNIAPLSGLYTNGTGTPNGSGLSAGTVNLPIPSGLSGGTYEVRLVGGTSGGTLARANDTDADSPTLIPQTVTGPTHGSLVMQPDGGFVYTPGNNFAGTDSFTYQVMDQTSLVSAPATVQLTVNPVSCGPRPSVQVRTTVSNGMLQATIVVTDVNGPTVNELKTITFGVPTNGRVIVAGQTHTDGFTLTPPPHTFKAEFSVQRVQAGVPTMVPLTIVDLCGSWSSFVGGGTSAGF